jgi:hypothetical protein
MSRLIISVGDILGVNTVSVQTLRFIVTEFKCRLISLSPSRSPLSEDGCFKVRSEL